MLPSTLDKKIDSWYDTDPSSISSSRFLSLVLAPCDGELSPGFLRHDPPS